MLLNWYSYSITGIWKWLGKMFEWSFKDVLEKLGWLPDVFYIALIAFLFVMWMFVMRSYYSNHEDKGIIK